MKTRFTALLTLLTLTTTAQTWANTGTAGFSIGTVTYTRLALNNQTTQQVNNKNLIGTTAENFETGSRMVETFTITTNFVIVPPRKPAKGLYASQTR
jgi:hypothetical protein